MTDLNLIRFLPYETITNKWPLPTKHSNKTISLKDTAMLSIFILIILVIILLFRNTKTRYLSIALILLFLFVLYKEPALYVHPYNFLLSCATNTPPYLNKDKYFPEYKLFENPHVWKKIRNELDNVLKNDKSIPFIHEYDTGQSYIGRASDDNKGWRIFVLKTMNKNIKSNCLQCPYTMSLINSVPSISTAMFSILDGKKHIPIHTGYYKGILRYHLGMIVPEPKKTFIIIHNKKYHWKEGEGVVFDDMFPHQVYNHSNKRRVILWFDIDRPSSFPFNKTNKLMNSAIHNSTYIQNNAKKIEKQVDL